MAVGLSVESAGGAVRSPAGQAGAGAPTSAPLPLPLWRTLAAYPHPLLVRTSLALALVGGFSTGLYLVLALAGLGVPVTRGAPALMQAHGQVQMLGFVALFIVAVGVQVLPGFHGSPIQKPALVAAGGLLLAGGVSLRAIAQVAEPSALRGAGLVLGALATLGGAWLVVVGFGRVRRPHSPAVRPRSARLLAVTLAGSLCGALLLNAAAAVVLATSGGALVPARLSEALLHLELWGVAATAILAVAGRLYPRFLLLRPTHAGLAGAALACWAAGSLGVPLAWLLLDGEPTVRALAWTAHLAGAVLFVIALRLYERPVRRSGTPWVTDPTRRWVRVAFAFLVLAAGLNTGLSITEVFSRGTAGWTAASAARHALAQGFVLPIMVVMAARILPGYSGHMLRRRRLLAALAWTLFAGAALRTGAELLGGYAPGWGAAVALGGLLTTAAFTVFAIGLWRHTRAVPAPASPKDAPRAEPTA